MTIRCGGHLLIVGLANESDNASELAYCLAEPFATTIEEWQLVHLKHKRKQRSVDALNAEITQLITPEVAQNGHGPPSEVNFLAACGVLPQRRQEVVTLPVKATNKWGDANGIQGVTGIQATLNQ